MTRSTLNEKHRYFSSFSLLEVWPHLYKVPLIWVSIGFNVIVSLFSLYLTNALGKNIDSTELALYVLCIASLVALAEVVNEGLVEWICVVEENTVRLKLCNAKSVASSVVNNDLGISISIIGFYVYLPSVLLSCALYAAYILFLSPLIFLMLACLVAFAIIPGKIYAKWRSRMILSIRSSRNILVDEYRERDVIAYKQIVNDYAKTNTEFFLKDTYALFALKVVVFLILLATLLVSKDTVYSLSLTIVMGLLLNSFHQLYNAVCDFQEDYHSLKKVRDSLSSLKS